LALVTREEMHELWKKAKKGEVIAIKTLISHEMETGYRHDNVGKQIPRDIISLFRVTYSGEEVFRMELFPAVAANPFIAFSTVAVATGELVFEWRDDKGHTHVEKTVLTVT